MQALTFSVSRWGRLTLARLVDDARPLGWALAVVLGVNLLTFALVREMVFSSERSLWALFVGLASVIVVAGAFRTMHEGRSSTDWLLWPATALEKYAAAVAELFAVPVILSLASMVASAFLAAVQWVFLGHPSPVWFPWADFQGVAAFGFLVFLLVILTGAATFRKHALWKTGLVVVTFGFVSTLLVLGFLWVVGVPGGIEGHWGARRMTFLRTQGFGASWHPSEGAQKAVEVLAQVWYFGLLPAFCLWYGWTKVREKEARDEVQ